MDSETGAPPTEVMSSTESFMAAAHHCAMTMFENACYVQGELGNVEMSDADRTQTEQLCIQLNGTKHDVISELTELQELIGTASSVDDLSTRVKRIQQWTKDDIHALHRLVTGLMAAAKEHPRYQLASMLVTESATNILHAYNDMDDAANAWLVTP